MCVHLGARCCILYRQHCLWATPFYDVVNQLPGLSSSVICTGWFWSCSLSTTVECCFICAQEYHSKQLILFLAFLTSGKFNNVHCLLLSFKISISWQSVIKIIFLKFFTKKDCWFQVKARKAVLPKLWSVLKSGGSGCATMIFPNLLPFLSKVPSEVCIYTLNTYFSAIIITWYFTVLFFFFFQECLEKKKRQIKTTTKQR